MSKIRITCLFLLMIVLMLFSNLNEGYAKLNCNAGKDEKPKKTVSVISKNPKENFIKQNDIGSNPKILTQGNSEITPGNPDIDESIIIKGNPNIDPKILVNLNAGCIVTPAP